MSNESNVRIQFIHRNEVRLSGGELSRYETIPYDKTRLDNEGKSYLQELMAPYEGKDGDFDISATTEVDSELQANSIRPDMVAQMNNIKSALEWKGNVQDRLSTTKTNKILFTVSLRNVNRTLSLGGFLSAISS